MFTSGRFTTKSLRAQPMLLRAARLDVTRTSQGGAAWKKEDTLKARAYRAAAAAVSN